MKILLINPPLREWCKPNGFPLGLGYIASILLQDRHEVEVLDINAYRWGREEVEERVKKASFDVVGIGGIVTTYKYIKWLLSLLKTHHPDKRRIVGGSVGSSIPGLMLERNPVDIVCVGEGEETVRALMKVLEREGDLSEVKGIWYREASGKIFENGNASPLRDTDS